MTYTIELTGSTRIEDTNPVISTTSTFTVVVEDGCALDVLTLVGSLNDNYVYYFDVDSDINIAIPPTGIPLTKLYAAEWTNSVQGCPIDFEIQILDSGTGNYRYLNTAEEAVVTLQNAISVSISQTYAS